MSQREKILSMIVGGVVLLLVNLFLFKFFLTNHGRLRGDLAANKLKMEQLALLQADRPLWEQRDGWVSGNLQRLENPDAAGAKLLEEVKDVARKHTVLVTPQPNAIDRIVRKPEYAAIRVNVEATSTWGGLIDFLAEMQGPGKFAVFESINLRKDSNDLTKMHATLKIARWYAPK